MQKKLKIMAAAAFATGFIGIVPDDADAASRGVRHKHSHETHTKHLTNKFNDATLVYYVRKGLLKLGKHFYHAGSGNREGLNNPAYERKRNRGPVPRGSFEVVPRESPFFGTESWRVLGTPGRSGILIHTDNIGLKGRPRGESNGCIVVDHNAYKYFRAEMHRLKPSRIIVKP